MRRTTAPPPPRRLLLVGLFTMLLVGLLTGCGGASSAPPGAGPNGAPTKFTSLSDLAAATAAQQKADKTAKITIVGGLTGRAQSGINGDGALRYDPTGPSMQLTQRIQTGGGAPVELGLVVLPDAAYVRPPANAGLPLPAGKSWLRIAPNATDPMSRQFGQLIQAIRDNADPAKSFAQFGDAVTILESAEEPLDGVPTVRYKLRVDLAKAADRQSDPTLKQSLQQGVQSGLTTLDYTLWLDAQNRTIRVLVDQPLPQNQGTFTLDARYRDWGQPVQIDPPPADQVFTR